MISTIYCLTISIDECYSFQSDFSAKMVEKNIVKNLKPAKKISEPTNNRKILHAGPFAEPNVKTCK